MEIPNVHAQGCAAIDDILPIDAGREGFVFPFLADAADFDVADILAGADQRPQP